MVELANRRQIVDLFSENAAIKKSMGLLIFAIFIFRLFQQAVGQNVQRASLLVERDAFDT